MSLIAAADFVLGAGGAMEREAAALGTPAYTVSRRGAPAAVDAALIAEGRLRPGAGARQTSMLQKKDRARSRSAACATQALFVEALLDLARHRSSRARLGRLVNDAGDAAAPPLV